MRRSIFLALLVFIIPACDDSTTGGTSTDGRVGDGTTTPYDGSLLNDFDQCSAVRETANNNYQPVDVIFAIDNSKSMGDEIAEVRANMNRFSKMVADKHLNMRIVMISCLPGQCVNANSNGICIDAPVGKTGGCQATPAADENLPGYRHVADRVPSQKALEWIVTHYADYKAVLRDEAVRHIVVVSDDTEEWTAAQFETALLAADAKFANYIFHAIYSYKSKEDACAIGTTEPCCTFAAPGGEGKVYRELVAKTKGVQTDLCLQDFNPVFDALGASVIGSAKLSCRWDIPAVPNGETLDPNKVNVVFTDKDKKETGIGKVLSAADCSKVTQGWYFDDPQDPKAVLVCPQTCTWIQADPGASMDLAFGCKSELAPIL